MKIKDCNIEVERSYETEVLYLKRLVQSKLEERLTKYKALKQTPEVIFEIKQEIRNCMDDLKNAIQKI